MVRPRSSQPREAAVGRARRFGISPGRSISSLSPGGLCMSAHARETRTHTDTPARTAPHRTRRLSTETKAAFKTTEFFAYVAVLVGVLIAAAVIDETDAGGFGARQAWLYATILTVGYMVSRGLAKSGSRDPYDADDDR